MPTPVKPSLRFFHSAALRTRTNRLLDAIEHDEDPTTHADALSTLVVDLTEAGFDYYFLLPLRKAKASFIARQTANIGMAGAVRVMAPIVRSILGRTGGDQLRVISRHIRQLMR